MLILPCTLHRTSFGSTGQRRRSSMAASSRARFPGLIGVVVIGVFAVRRDGGVTDVPGILHHVSRQLLLAQHDQAKGRERHPGSSQPTL